MGMDDFHRRQNDPAFEEVRRRMRWRLEADPTLAHMANTDPQVFAQVYDREKQVMTAEHYRASVTEALLSEPESEEPETDYTAEALLEQAKASGKQEDVIEILKYMDEKDGLGGGEDD